MQEPANHTQRLERILEFSHDLASTTSLEPLLHRIVAAATELIGSEAAAILLLNPSGELRFVASSNLLDNLVDIPVPLEGSIAGAAVTSGKPQIISDARTDSRHFKAVNTRMSRETRSLLAVPLRFQERIIGTLETENKDGGEEFSDADVETLTLLAAHAAVAIENARMVGELRESREELERRVVKRTEELSMANAALELEVVERKRAEEAVKHMAYHDALTGLPNRVLFHDRLQQAIALADRNRRSAAVLMLDVDHFKEVNDELGHDVGDALLKAVAIRLRTLVRKSDTVARMGGDEFTLVLPEAAKPEDAAEVAEKIVGAFQNVFVLNGREVHVTTSVGAAMYPEDGESATALMKSADIAMYQAKQAGRNGYRLYSRDLEE